MTFTKLDDGSFQDSSEPRSVPNKGDFGPYWLYLLRWKDGFFIVDHSGGSYFELCEVHYHLSMKDVMLIDWPEPPSDDEMESLWYVGGKPDVYEDYFYREQEYNLEGDFRPATRDEIKELKNDILEVKKI